MDDLCAENLGDDDIFVANYEVSRDRTMIVKIPRNMLKNLKCEDLVLSIGTECEICFNVYPVHMLGCVSKQQRFHPISYELLSNEDQLSYIFLTR